MVVRLLLFVPRRNPAMVKVSPRFRAVESRCIQFNREFVLEIQASAHEGGDLFEWFFAVVVELADTQASGACARKGVEVQVLFTALSGLKNWKFPRPLRLNRVQA